MTKISTIHDTIISKLAALFPAMQRIPNAYSLIDNPEQFLKESYGLKYNGSERIGFEFCNRREKASFAAVFSREFFKLDTKQTAFDNPTKLILESAESFKAEFYKTDNLGDSNIIAVDVASTSGLANLTGDKYNFLNIEVQFTVDYHEVIA